MRCRLALQILKKARPSHSEIQRLCKCSGTSTIVVLCRCNSCAHCTFALNVFSAITPINLWIMNSLNLRAHFTTTENKYTHGFADNVVDKHECVLILVWLGPFDQSLQQQLNIILFGGKNNADYLLVIRVLWQACKCRCVMGVDFFNFIAIIVYIYALMWFFLYRQVSCAIHNYTRNRATTVPRNTVRSWYGNYVQLLTICSKLCIDGFVGTQINRRRVLHRRYHSKCFCT